MSAASVVGEIVSVVGALGLGSVLGQYLASSKDRREVRARVLSAIAEVEESRWVGEGTATSAQFQAALRNLQAAALVARLPRHAVREYAVLAQAARWLSQEEWDRLGDPEIGGGIDARLSDATREAAKAVAELVWSWKATHKWRWRRSKRRIKQDLAKLQSDDANRSIERSRGLSIM